MRYAIEMKDGSIQIMTVFPQKKIEKSFDRYGAIQSEKVIEFYPDPTSEIDKWDDMSKSQVLKIRLANEGEPSSHRRGE